MYAAVSIGAQQFSKYEQRHVISNNVAFWQVLTQMSLYNLILSLDTPNGFQSIA